MLGRVCDFTPSTGDQPPPISGWYLVLNSYHDAPGWLVVLLDTCGDRYSEGKPMARVWRRAAPHCDEPERRECRLFWIENDWVDPDLAFSEFDPILWFHIQAS